MCAEVALGGNSNLVPAHPVRLIFHQWITVLFDFGINLTVVCLGFGTIKVCIQR